MTRKGDKLIPEEVYKLNQKLYQIFEKITRVKIVWKDKSPVLFLCKGEQT